jgi:hypothetical protein
VPSVADVTAELAAELATLSLPLTVTVDRQYLAEIDIGGFDDLTILVSPVKISTERMARGGKYHEAEILCLVLQKVTAVTPAVIDPLIEFVQSLDAAFDVFPLRFLATSEAKLLATRTDPVYDARTLRERSAFASSVIATYRWAA